MEKNKTRSYFLYAIGEILLVVIGILIALQINNWNEYRIERELEKDLLIQLQSEYQNNLKQLDDKMAMRSSMISSAHRLIDYIDHPEMRNEDSTYYFLGRTLVTPTFDPIVNDIISSGRMQLIQNADLRTLLTRWTSDLIQVTEEEETWAEFRTNTYSPTLRTYVSTRTISNRNWESGLFSTFQLDGNTDSLGTIIGDSKKRNYYHKLLDDPEFESHIAYCFSFTKVINSQSQSLRNRITEILDLIQNKIKNP